MANEMECVLEIAKGIVYKAAGGNLTPTRKHRLVFRFWFIAGAISPLTDAHTIHCMVCAKRLWAEYAPSCFGINVRTERNATIRSCLKWPPFALTVLVSFACNRVLKRQRKKARIVGTRCM